MFTVYVLRNEKTGRHYIGCTHDLDRRLIEHNRGQTKSTRQQGPWNLLYMEEYKTLTDAQRRERLIKSYKGGNAFKRLLERG